RTGYIKSENIGKFFSKLEGSFQVRIYDSEHLISNLISNSRVVYTPAGEVDTGKTTSSILTDRKPNPLVEGDIDIRKLEQNIKNISPSKTFERKRIYNMIYQEAMLSTERDVLGNEKGISFTNMLLLLAHYKLVNDEKCLTINEYIKRANKLEQVKDSVSRDRVRSLLRTIYWRRKFKAIRENRRSKVES
ncbi:5806_t:CDS:2, partial [Acaulospora morrowiae]